MIRGGVLNFDDRYNNQEDHAPQGTTDVQRSKKEGAAMRRSRECPVLDMRKAFFLARNDFNGPDFAAEMSQRWIERVPDAIVSIVSGSRNFHTWKRDDFRSEFQTGFVNLLGNLDLLVIDDGLDYGMSRLVATAAKREEMFRDYLADNMMQLGHRKPFLQYFGFVPMSKVAERTGVTNIQDLNAGRTSEVPVTVVSSPGITENSGFGISPYRSNYLLMDKKYDDASFLRVDIEKQLQNELGSRLGEKEGNAVNDGAVPFVPHIVFFFQGELDELDRIRAYVQLRTPVVIMDKCGGMGDILAFAVNNSAEPDERRTRSNLAQRLAKSFPEVQNNNEMKFDYVDKILQIVRDGAGKGGKLLYVADCSRLDTFTNLDKPFLQALINSSAEKNATPDQANRNFKLCIQLNQPEIASTLLLDAGPWNKLPGKVAYSAMLAALMAPNREAFVDLLLRQKFPLRFFTSHLDLLLLFRKANGRDLFVGYVWDDILGHSQTEPVREDFILRELNPLIQQLTGIRNFLDLHELSRIALTRDDSTVADPGLADANSLRALVVFGVFFDRPKLLKVLLKYAYDPIPTCVIIESLYRGIYRHINSEELHDRLKKQADEFGGIATDILDAGIKESPMRARSFFLRPVPEANNKTTLEMAFDARNKKFIGHQTIQTWLDQFGFNFVRVKGALPTLKLLLSAYFILPMFFWLTFPKVRQDGKRNSHFAGPKEEVAAQEPRSLEEKKSHLAALDRTNSSPARQAKKQKEYRPSLPLMLWTIWSAPIVKFTTWFLIYLAFLVLIGVDMMLPSCTNIGVDIAVFIITVLIWLELVTRTTGDVLWKHTRIGWTLRTVDILFQTVWIIIFFLYRIAPFRYEHPYTGRVILAFGVMYYYYSVWVLFYPINRMIGPFTRIMNVMWLKDMTKWIVLMIPLFVSTGVIWQALITPDYPFTGEDWRRAFYRATFTIFGAFYNELEYNPQCERTSKIDYNNFTQPNTAYPVDRCWLGDYSDYTCNTVSFWSYFFVIQYYFLLKLGMMVILLVFFIFRMLAEKPKADLLWSYYRFKLLHEYHLRPVLPFPFSIIGNIWIIIKHFISKKDPNTKEIGKLDPESDVKLDTFIYWKHKANMYLTQKDQQAAAQGLPKRQNALLGAIKGDLQSILAKFNEMDKKLSSVDENAKEAHTHVHNTARNILREDEGENLTAMDLHQVLDPTPPIQSRETFYPDTAIRRFFVPDEKVDWSAVYDQYYPKTFNKPFTDFTPEEQDFVDRERDDRQGRTDFRRSASENGEAEWNTIQYEGTTAIYRKSWVTDEDGQPMNYRIDINNFPLNPRGRTGIRGRGHNSRYGPNHRIILAITSALAKKPLRFIMQSALESLPHVPLCQYYSEYAIAAVLIDSIFNKTESDEDSSFDPDLVTSEDSLAKTIPVLLKQQWLNERENQAKAVPPVRVRELYRGYLDSPINTDNAWTEALILRIDVPFAQLGQSSEYRWRNAEGSDWSDLSELDATVIRSLKA